MKLTAVGLFIAAAVMSGCAFDIVQVTQAPTQFTAATDSNNDFQLTGPVTAHLGTGFPTHLLGGSHWTKVGTVPEGSVYRTPDQIVKVEGSNIQEAWIVVSNGTLVGFYQPVEKTFAPLASPVALPLERFTPTPK